MQKELRDEEWILAEIAKGNQLAFGKLFNFYRNKVYGYALALLQTESLAEEIVQNVFLKLWLKREELVTITNFGGFLRVIAKNESLNALKKIALEKKNTQVASEHTLTFDFNTENAVQLKETQQILDSAIEGLPPQQKIIYRLCQIEGVKQKDVADQLNISPLTVKAHLRDAVKSIRAYLTAHQNINVYIFFLVFLK
jgi:RNA polymerase sigma-70 factor (family 1)